MFSKTREAMRRADADIQPDAPIMPEQGHAVSAPMAEKAQNGADWQRVNAKRPADQPPATYAETTGDVISRSLDNYRHELARLNADITKLETDRENLRKGIAALEAASDALLTANLEAAIDADAAEV